MQNAYARSLRWCLDRQTFTFGLFAASLAASVVLFAVVPKDFLPSDDTGRIFGYTEGTSATSLEEMVRNPRIAADIARADPAVEEVLITVGAGGSRTTVNSGMLVINLKPLHERTDSADDVVRRLRRTTANIPGRKVYMQNPPVIRIGGSISKGQYQYVLQDIDTAVLYEGAER
jgi:HAE1 family hydrophobic/amphiphilic exporter-1